MEGKVWSRGMSWQEFTMRMNLLHKELRMIKLSAKGETNGNNKNRKRHGTAAIGFKGKTIPSSPTEGDVV